MQRFRVYSSRVATVLCLDRRWQPWALSMLCRDPKYGLLLEIYIYMYVHACMCMYIYIYVYSIHRGDAIGVILQGTQIQGPYLEP